MSARALCSSGSEPRVELGSTEVSLRDRFFLPVDKSSHRRQSRSNGSMGVSVRLTAGVAVLLLRCSTPGAESSRVARVVGIRVQLSEAGRRRSASQWRYISEIIAHSCLNEDRAETAYRQGGLTGSAGNLKLL